MILKIDHITMANPCQVWVQRETGPTFPLLFEEVDFKAWFTRWIHCGMQDFFEYDPELDRFRFPEGAFFQNRGEMS